MNSKRWLIKLLTSQIYSQKAFTLSFQYCLRVLPGGNLSQPSSMVSSKQFEAKQLQSCMPPQTGYQLAPFVIPFLKFPAAMSQLFRFLSVMLAWQQAKNCAISLRKKAPILLLLKLIVLFMFVFSYWKSWSSGVAEYLVSWLFESSYGQFTTRSPPCKFADKTNGMSTIQRATANVSFWNFNNSIRLDIINDEILLYRFWDFMSF